MSCPTLEKIHAYNDGELSARDRPSFERHLEGCPGCRAALDGRRAIAEAAGSLAAFEVPEDFVRGIMARLPEPAAAEARTKLTIPGRIAAALAGTAALGAAAVTISLFTGTGLFGIFLGVGRFLWTTIQTSSQGILKAAKLVVLLGKMGAELLAKLVEGFKIVTSFIGPEVQIAVIGTTFVLVIAAGLLWGRKFILERTHDQS
jgi:predicted anti-sigma-YlaC factor YlaD